jgi:hypothetical protein
MSEDQLQRPKLKRLTGGKVSSMYDHHAKYSGLKADTQHTRAQYD